MRIRVGKEEEKELTPQEMVDWYDPGQLARTGSQVVVSTLFGQNADNRLIEALATTAQPDFFDHTYAYKMEGDNDYVLDQSRPRDPNKPVWIDYVADLGDGFNSTYAIAYYLTQPKLVLETEEKNERHETSRGEILIFGGDEVYPTAERKRYEQRLVRPYEAALSRTTYPYPHAYAIPGNHDWYDSLVSLSRLFCNRRWFAGWRTQQARSYFALKLPHGWWLIGTDVQLGSDIDGPQVAYFRKVAAHMKDSDHIILCNAEPHWIYSAIYKQYDSDVYNESNLAFLENKVFKKKITIYLSGDLHHYRRHEKDEGRVKIQKFTAGGGGAFLHPTHGPNVDELPGGFKLKGTFPHRDTSRRLCWRNFLFPFAHKKFGLLIGLLYVLTSRSVLADVARYGLSEIFSALKATVNAILTAPFALFWVLLVFLSFWLFTDTHSRRYRFIAGTLHGTAHLLAVFFLGWFASSYTVSNLHLEFRSTPQLLSAGAVIFIGGWLVGSLIMGTYLFVSLNCFKRHSNEAFSSLAIADYKNFLRLKIDPTGKLTIFPIGIEKVPRHWKPSEDSSGEGPQLVPDDPKATQPKLIESPVG
jgi:calcineurin-like phosphoesterase family protein